MKEDLINEILELKEKKNAIILAHYYVDEEIQKIADFVGDSFFLAKKASTTNAEIIVFAGVKFMGESAKILNPTKKVLMPDINADCPMAHMATIEDILKVREKYEDVAVVCYVNSTAELKKHADVCVTSSNAIKIVKELPNKNIFFIPDRNLGSFVAFKVPEKNIILNDGHCPIHNKVQKQEVLDVKDQYPNSEILTHPECIKEVRDISDYIGSTLEIINYVNKSDKKEFIICTEIGVDYELQKNNPDKIFHYVMPKMICEDMKKNSLEKIRDVLKNENNEIILTDKEISLAKSSLLKMLELAK